MLQDDLARYKSKVKKMVERLTKVEDHLASFQDQLAGTTDKEDKHHKAVKHISPEIHTEVGKTLALWLFTTEELCTGSISEKRAVLGADTPRE